MPNRNSWTASAAARGARAKERFFAYCAEHWPEYDLSQFEWNGTTTKGIVICPEHGPWLMRPADLTSGYGCRKCGCRAFAQTRKKGVDQWIIDWRAVHGDKYDYSLVVELGSNKGKVTIVCPEHGPFKQQALKHMQGKGCPVCGKKQSLAETEVRDYIVSLGFDVESRVRGLIPGKGWEIDVYIPKLKIGFEYCGLYWHSDLSMKRPVEIHADKYKLAKEVGIDLVFIFEDEWLHRRKACESLIRNRLGLNGSVGARECTVNKEDIPRAFYEDHHIQGAPNGGVHYTLRKGKDIVAAMTFQRGGPRRGTSEWVLARYASRGRVNGGASRLLSAFLKDHRPERVWTYSDKRLFNGGLYEKLGFTKDGDVAPDYTVVFRNRRLPKQQSRRERLPILLRRMGKKDTFDPASDPRSEAEVLKQNKIGRIWDCGKVRWLLTPDYGANQT